MIREPAGLGARGSQLFRELVKDEKNPLVIQAVIEAARAADRLDDLDRAIQGEGVLDLMRAALEDQNIMGDEMKVTVKLSFAGVLMEGRQQQDNFRKLIAEVARLKATIASKADQSPQKPEEPKSESTVESELDRRRKAREARRSG